MDDEKKMMQAYESDDGPDDVHPVEVIDYGDCGASACDSGE